LQFGSFLQQNNKFHISAQNSASRGKLWSLIIAELPSWSGMQVRKWKLCTIAQVVSSLDVHKKMVVDV